MIRGGLTVIEVADVGRAVRFYVETLGMKLVDEGGGDGDGPDDAAEAVVDAGDGFRFALAEVTGRRPAAAQLVFFSKIPLDQAVAILDNRGVAIERRADRAHFADPDGHTLTLRIPS